MFQTSLSLEMKQMAIGNGLLVLCSIFYLLWWLASFKPQRTASNRYCGIMLVLAFFVGVAGIFFAVRGCSSLHNIDNAIPIVQIVLIGILSYIVLFLISFFVFKRPVTTELALIVGWATLELCILDLLYSQQRIGMVWMIAFCALIAVAVIVSMGCYLIYYRLNDSKRYVDGCIPLILEGVIMLVITLRILIS